MQAPSSIPMDRISNLRDLGGVAGFDGLMIRRKRLFRSSSPHEGTQADQVRLRELGITVCIDLRTEGERLRQPYAMEGIRSIGVPLAEEGIVESVTSRFRDGSMTSEELEDWWELIGVANAAETQAEGIRRAFRTLIDHPYREAALFHCRGGKDRTGLLAGLLLEALGASREAIMADFAASRHSPTHLPPGEARMMEEMIERLGLSDEALRSLRGVRPEWLDAVFGRLEARYGSVVGYLEHRVGLGSEGIERLRAGYLEPSAVG